MMGTTFHLDQFADCFDGADLGLDPQHGVFRMALAVPCKEIRQQAETVIHADEKPDDMPDPFGRRGCKSF